MTTIRKKLAIAKSVLPKQPKLKAKMYYVSVNEWKVLVGLLKKATASGSLTRTELARLSYDPKDIVKDNSTMDVIGVTVWHK